MFVASAKCPEAIVSCVVALGAKPVADIFVQLRMAFDPPRGSIVPAPGVLDARAVRKARSNFDLKGLILTHNHGRKNVSDVSSSVRAVRER